MLDSGSQKASLNYQIYNKKSLIKQIDSPYISNRQRKDREQPDRQN